MLRHNLCPYLVCGAQVCQIGVRAAQHWGRLRFGGALPAHVGRCLLTRLVLLISKDHHTALVALPLYSSFLNSHPV